MKNRTLLLAILASICFAALAAGVEGPHARPTVGLELSWMSGGAVVSVAAEERATLARVSRSALEALPRDPRTPIFSRSLSAPGGSIGNSSGSVAGGLFFGSDGLALYDPEAPLDLGCEFDPPGRSVGINSTAHANGLFADRTFDPYDISVDYDGTAWEKKP